EGLDAGAVGRLLSVLSEPPAESGPAPGADRIPAPQCADIERQWPRARARTAARGEVIQGSHFFRHGRACLGHPRLSFAAGKTWMPGTSWRSRPSSTGYGRA